MVNGSDDGLEVVKVEGLKPGGFWKGYALSGALALVSGILFRLAGTLELPFLTMFGFWALVAAGLNVARVTAIQQAATGLACSLSALVALGPDFEVIGPVRDRDIGSRFFGFGPFGPIVVASPARLAVLVPNVTPDYGRGPLVRRRLAAGAERAERLATALRRGLGRLGYDVDVRAVLLLLRRRSAAQDRTAGPGVDLIDPEDIGRFFRGWLDPEKHDAGTRRQLARRSAEMLRERES